MVAAYDIIMSKWALLFLESVDETKQEIETVKYPKLLHVHDHIFVL